MNNIYIADMLLHRLFLHGSVAKHFLLTVKSVCCSTALNAVPEKLVYQNVKYHFTLGTFFLIFNEHCITFGELVYSLNNSTSL